MCTSKIYPIDYTIKMKNGLWEKIIYKLLFTFNLIYNYFGGMKNLSVDDNKMIIIIINMERIKFVDFLSNVYFKNISDRLYDKNEKWSMGKNYL